MKKQSKVKKFFNKLFSSKSGRIFFVVACLIVSAVLGLCAWAIQGKDIGAILVSDSFIFWYVIIGVALVSALALIGMVNERFKK